MRVNDAVFGAILMAVAAWLFAEARTFPALPGVPYGPGVFPKILSAVLFLAGAALVVQGVRTLGGGGLVAFDDWARRPRAWLVFAAVSGSLVFYVAAAETLGFLLTATLMLAAVFLAVRGRRGLALSAVLAAGFPFVVHAAFVRALRVPLPDGTIWGAW
jgi:putative tricarboxylic transport membrane protein